MNRNYVIGATIGLVLFVMCSCAPPVEPEMETEETLKYTCVIEHDEPQFAIGDNEWPLWDYWYWHRMYPGGRAMIPDSIPTPEVQPPIPYDDGWGSLIWGGGWNYGGTRR